MQKPKIGLYWCSSCGGCEESVVDLAEDILKVTEAADIAFWPVALDFKYEDIRALKDNEMAAVFINGAVRTTEQKEIAELLRAKSKLVIAHGSCAHLGGVVGLGNFSSNDELLGCAFKDAPSILNPEDIRPKTNSRKDGELLALPGLLPRVRPLNEVIKVDYYIPGCPPNTELIKDAIFKLLSGKLPEKGAVLADKKALCDSCPRRDSKPEKLKLGEFKRIYEVELDEEECFLKQGIICLGPSTRGGCGARCINANFPCRGCFGPLEGVIDQGAKSLSAIAAIIGSEDEDAIKKTVDSIPDKAGLFYRYSLATSLLKGKQKIKNQK